MYQSTRSNYKCESAEAIVRGISLDGGLFFPEVIKPLKIEYMMKDFTYQEMAKVILKHFFTDFKAEVIDKVINESYNEHNFSEEIIKIKSFKDYSFVELFHGPTMAFKDMALTILPNLMQEALKKIGINKKVIILTATSGDTGSATLNGFSKNPNIETIVLYPFQGISDMQEKQMLLYTNEHAHALAYLGNFDDCQKKVKELMNKYQNDPDILITSGNSINIGRLIPQIVYYYYSYFQLVKNKTIRINEYINVCVPTGNFGNILACYMAKLMGLPIRDIICASNNNHVLTDFFTSGTYDSNRKLYKTNSPSMDIIVSSNLERLLFVLTNNNIDETKEYMDLLKTKGIYKIKPKLYQSIKEIKAEYVNELETESIIDKVFKKHQYIIDPHTAVAYGSYCKYIMNKTNRYHTLIISTASPYKFPETIAKSLALKGDIINEISKLAKIEIPSSVLLIKNSNKNRVIVNEEQVESYIKINKLKKVIVKTPATSANLGTGFDFLGLALNLYNEISFEKTINDNQDNSLIMKAFKYTYKKANQKEIFVNIQMLKNEIPISRGLGSSASCIVSGVLAANAFMNNYFKPEQLFQIMVELEGHPDNIASCYFGGLKSSYYSNDEYKTIDYSINDNYKFIVMIPPFKTDTHQARLALPKELLYTELVHNTSRAINIPLAFNSNNIQFLKETLNDVVHEKYRLPLISQGDLIFNKIKKYNYLISLISGSGPTIINITTDVKRALKLLNSFKLDEKWEIKEVEIDYIGSVVAREYE